MKIKNNKTCSYIYLGLVILSNPIVAMADTDAATTLQNVLQYLTGPVGKVVATLAIVGMGYACFAMGRIAKSYFVSVVVGIAIVFGANTLLGIITSG